MCNKSYLKGRVDINGHIWCMIVHVLLLVVFQQPRVFKALIGWLIIFEQVLFYLCKSEKSHTNVGAVVSRLLWRTAKVIHVSILVLYKSNEAS